MVSTFPARFFFWNSLMCHFQALRYPYFQVGHPLGSTAHSLQESGKSQKDVLEKAAAPPHVKPVPPAQPPAKPHTRISSRQHQAGQPPQHLVYPYKAEAPRTDHLPEDKPSPLLLPSLHPKHPQAVSRTVHSGALSGCSFADPTSSSSSSFFNNFIYLFWLYWVFIACVGFSLVAVPGLLTAVASL